MIQLKKITFLTTFLVASVASATSMLPQLENARRANLEKVEMDAQHATNATHGLVEVNDQEVLLYVFERFHCPEGRMCAMVKPAPRIFRAKIVEVSKACGSDVIVARRDLRPADGSLIEITVMDHTNRMCRDMRRGRIEITLSETSARNNRYESHLYGQEGFDKPAVDADAKVALSEIRIDDTGRDEVFGGAFNADTGSIAKLGDTITVSVIPHTIYCAAVVGANCPNPTEHKATLTIIAKKAAGCGSTLTIAKGKVRLANGKLANATLELTDHGTRLCEDYRPNLVEATYSVQLKNRRTSVNELRARKSLFIGN